MSNNHSYRPDILAEITAIFTLPVTTRDMTLPPGVTLAALSCDATDQQVDINVLTHYILKEIPVCALTHEDRIKTFLLNHHDELFPYALGTQVRVKQYPKYSLEVERQKLTTYGTRYYDLGSERSGVPITLTDVEEAFILGIEWRPISSLPFPLRAV